MPASYTRKVSSEEAREGYLLIEKAKLGSFPPPGVRFTLEDAAGSRETAIEAHACQCRGPEKPHEHYHLPLAGLRAGQRVTVTVTGEGRIAVREAAPGA